MGAAQSSPCAHGCACAQSSTSAQSFTSTQSSTSTESSTSSESSTSAQCFTSVQFDLSTKTENDTRLRPYGVTANSCYLQLNSSCRTLYSGMVAMARDNKYADLLVICGNDRYYVHRAIVCPRSAFFDERCSSPQYAGHSSPYKPCTVWVDPSDCESHVLAAVLAFLYTLDYNAIGKQAVAFAGSEKGLKPDDFTFSGVHTTGKSAFEDGQRESDSAFQSISPSTVSSEFIPTPSESGTRCFSMKNGPEMASGNETSNKLVFHLQVLEAANRFGIQALCDVAKNKFLIRLRIVREETGMLGCLRHLYHRSAPTTLAEEKEIATQSAVASFSTLKTLDGWTDLVGECPDFCVEMFKRLQSK